MADAPLKISELPPAQTANDADQYPVVQSAQTRRQTLAQLRTALFGTVQTFMRTFLNTADQAAARAAIGAEAAGVLNISAGHIDGLTLVWNSANSISVTPGAAYIASLGDKLNVAATITKASLVLSATTWYHVYLYSNAGAADIEIVTTAPSAKVFGNARTKTGDTSRRYIGSIRTVGANTILRFVQSCGRVSFLADALTAPLQVLSNGVATTSTSVSFSATAPVTATHSSINIINLATNAVTLIVAPSDPGVPASTTFGTFYLGKDQLAAAEFPIGSALSLLYVYATAPGASGAYIRATGYLFER